jgi:hypothetical protein
MGGFSLLERLKVFLIQILSCLIDSCFLVLWVVIQWGTDYLIKSFKLSHLNMIWFNIFQVILGLSTLVPILMYIYTDIRIMVMSYLKKISELRDGVNDNASK